MTSIVTNQNLTIENLAKLNRPSSIPSQNFSKFRKSSPIIESNLDKKSIESIKSAKYQQPIEIKIINIDSINLLYEITFINEKFEIINKINDKELKFIVEELNRIYNEVKINPYITFPKDRFEIIIKEEKDFESDVITKTGYVVDSQFKTNSDLYDITDINNSIIINNFYKSLNILNNKFRNTS
jgi:hypothetical protein